MTPSATAKKKKGKKKRTILKMATPSGKGVSKKHSVVNASSLFINYENQSQREGLV